METLGLYIQVPFCASKCSFCNFSSRVAPRDVFDRYCAALIKEIELLPDFYRVGGVRGGLLESPVDSVYFGGGTPTLLGGDRLAKILSALCRRFRFASSKELTIEVTPGSADGDYLKQAMALGVNRLSIGAQSFEDVELRSVGRLHTAEDTRRLVQTARDEGIGNISLDLIAGLPHQSSASWHLSVETVIVLRPVHVSIYLFEIDEKSRLGKEVLQHGSRYHADSVPDEDFMADAYEHARKALHQAGYVQYEISNFALPGNESIHNRKYWQLKPYVGLGAGSHSFDGRARWANVVSADEYERCVLRGDSPICEKRVLSADAQLGEFFFLGLRQMEGINLLEAHKRWGRERVEPWARRIEALERDGWIERHKDCIRLTENALLVSNEIFQEFIAA